MSSGPATHEGIVEASMVMIAHIVETSSREELRKQISCMERAVEYVLRDVALSSLNVKKLSDLDLHDPLRRAGICSATKSMDAAMSAANLMLFTLSLIREKYGEDTDKATVVRAKVNELCGKITAVQLGMWAAQHSDE